MTTQITADEGRYVRDDDGTWRYADSGLEVPGARDMSIDDYGFRVVNNREVHVPRSMARERPELRWCLDVGVRVPERPGTIAVPVEEWDRRASEPLGMWAPELSPDARVRALAIAEREYRRARQRLEEELEEAKRRRDESVRLAAREGLSYRQIAAAIGLSHQRVAQIITEG